MSGNEDKKELLREIFANVNYWISYGEAKNAGLLAFNMALMAAIFSLNKINIFTCFVAGMSVISMIIALVSILPKIGEINKENKPVKVTDNLLFYQDIAKYSEDEFLKIIYETYFNEVLNDISHAPHYECDIAKEICINARIAARKYRLFKVGAWVDICALLAIAVMCLIA